MNEKIAKRILEKSKKDYNQLASEFSKTRVYLWPEMDSLFKYIRNNDSVLDLGCGNGRLYKFFQNKLVKYTGLDSCRKLIDLAKKQFQVPNFIVADAMDLPFEDNQFDLVFAIALLHHIPSQTYRLRVLKEIKRVLKKDGLLVLTVWNLWQPRLLLKYKIWPMIFGWRPRDLDWRDVFIPWKLPNKKIVYRYYHAFTMLELKRLIEQAGFKIIDYYYAQKSKKTSWSKGRNLIIIVKKP